MFISRKKFERELEAARNNVLKEIDTDRRFQEMSNRIYDLERRMYELGCKVEKSEEKKQNIEDHYKTTV